MLFFVGLPGLIDDSGWWADLVKKVSGMTIPDYIYATGTVLGGIMVIQFTYCWWLPKLGFNPNSNSDAQAFSALVPLIEQVIRFKERPEDPYAMPSGIDMEKAWRLDAELHKLDIPHPDLKPDDNRIVQAAILTGLLSCANRSDLKGARGLFQRTDDDFLCDWEPEL